MIYVLSLVIGSPNSGKVQRQTQTLPLTLAASLVPLISIALIVVCGFYLWRRKKMNYPQLLPLNEPLPPALAAPPTPELSLKPVELLEIKARGRFGCVWRARLLDAIVAVKVFPPGDRQSWLTEREFYRLAQVGRHDNVLHFIGTRQQQCAASFPVSGNGFPIGGNGFPSSAVNVGVGLGSPTAYWLITDYHDRGSLYDYLKSNVISIAELARIATSLSSGVAFLHAVVPAVDGQCEKPSVAHRDIKSRNVLLKQDLTACVSDFGLALVLDHHPGDVHGQVN